MAKKPPAKISQTKAAAAASSNDTLPPLPPLPELTAAQHQQLAAQIPVQNLGQNLSQNPGQSTEQKISQNAPQNTGTSAGNGNGNGNGGIQRLAAGESVPHIRAAASAPRFEAPRPEALAAARENANTRKPFTQPIAEPPRSKDEAGSWPFYTGLGLTGGWFLMIMILSGGAISTGTVFGIPVTAAALGLAAAVAPVALLWMVIAYFQRARDVRAATEPLRRQLQMVLGTGIHAEARVKRFNEALERQLELMRQAGDGSYDLLHNAIQVLQEEERAIGSLADRSGREIQRVAGIVRDNSEILEDLLHANHERFNELSGRIAGHIASLDERSASAAGRLAEMIDRVSSFVDDFKHTADRKLTECSELGAEISRQEKETEAASRRMHETLQAARLGAAELGTLLHKNQETLDTSGQKLAERMLEIGKQIDSFAAANQKKEENLADRSKGLSETLAREIVTLEALTNRLDGQMEEASKGFGQRATTLDEKQAELAEKTGVLMLGLQNVISQLDQTATTALGKFTAIRDDVSKQAVRASEAFDRSGDKYEVMAEKLENISKNVATRVESIGNKLVTQFETIETGSARAVDAAGSTENSVNRAVQALEVMIGRIFDAEKRVNDGAGSITQSFERSFSGFTTAADEHIAKLRIEHDRFEESNQNLAARARESEGTWQSLVASAQHQQQVMQEQLKTRVLEACELLNENAYAIEAARDSLAAHVEAGLSRSEELTLTLARVGEMTSAPFAEAVTRVRTAVEEGERHLSHFTATLHKGAGEVNEINGRLLRESEAAGMKAAETLAGLDAIAARMEAIQHDSSRSTGEVVERLDSMATHVQNRMGEISQTADTEQKKLAETVRQLSFDINGLIHDSQVADTRVRMAAALLTEQAGEVRREIGNQAIGVENSLAALHGRFASMAEQMHTTTSAAHQQIDEISLRYSAIAELSQQGLQDKITHMGNVIGTAHEMLEGFTGAVDARVAQFQDLDQQVRESRQGMEGATESALDRLSVFTHALVASRASSAETAEEIFARLTNVQDQFNRQISAVSDGSKSIATDMRDAVQTLVEQSVGLAAVAQQTEGKVSSLTETTAALQAQAESTRAAIEEQAARMQERMAEVAARIESANFALERNAAVAFDRTEGMSRRFENISEEAFGRLSETATELNRIADGSVVRVADVNRALTDQIASLTFAGEHLAEMEAELRKNAETSSAHLNRLASEAGATAAYAAEQLRTQISGLKTEADGMLMRFEALGRGLANQSIGVLDVTEGLEEKIGRLRDTTVAVYEDAHRAGQSIISSTFEFKNEVATAVQNMAATGEALQQRGDFTISMVHQMAQRFTEATQNLREQFEGEAARLQQVANAAQDHIQHFAGELAKGTDALDAAGTRMDGTGQQVSETLEKANFLLRNITAQIERMRTGAETISGGLIQRMTETIAAFEAELNDLTTTTDAGFDGLSLKVKGIGAAIRQDAAAASNDVVISLAKLRSEMESDFGQVAEQASAAITRLSTHGSAAAQQLQNDFRDNILGMAEALTGHLRQVHERSGSIIESIREGAGAGAEESMKMLLALRRATEEEVGSMKQGVEATLEEMSGTVERLRGEMKAGRSEISAGAIEVFSQMRERMEEEARAILTRADIAMRTLQESCNSMTQEMSGTISAAEQSAEAFTGITATINREAGKIGETVIEANQNMTATHALLQRSQGALFDVVQKSGEALTHFNDNISQQARSLTELQRNVEDATGKMEHTDQRLSSLKSGFESVLEDLNQRLNQSMSGLGQSVLQVRSESEEAARDVVRHTAEVAAQHESIRQTAMALAKALSDLENANRGMNRSLSDQARNTLSNARLSAAAAPPPPSVSQIAAQQQAAQQPQAPQAAAPQQPAPRPAAAQPQQPPVQPQQVSISAKETPEETLRRLRALGASIPPAQSAAVAAAVGGAKPVPGLPPASTGNKADSDLISSLTQIIQQLEDTPGTTKTPPGSQKKAI